MDRRLLFGRLVLGLAHRHSFIRLHPLACLSAVLWWFVTSVWPFRPPPSCRYVYACCIVYHPAFVAASPFVGTLSLPPLPCFLATTAPLPPVSGPARGHLALLSPLPVNTLPPRSSSLLAFVTFVPISFRPLTRLSFRRSRLLVILFPRNSVFASLLRPLHYLAWPSLPPRCFGFSHFLCRGF